MTNSISSTYSNRWKNDQQNDYRIFYYDNGERYEGAWKNDQPHGQGKYYDANGRLRYEGAWENDQRHGQGKYYDANGNLRYEGAWKNDQRHGQGKYYDANGNLRYAGAWENDQQDGYGIFYYDNGERYEGDWKNDKRNGQGKYYNPNGNLRYEGAWQDGQRNGQGKYYDANGNLRYEGAWQDGQRDGQGTSYFPHGGIRYKGKWKNDKEKNNFIQFIVRQWIEGIRKPSPSDSDAKMRLQDFCPLNTWVVQKDKDLVMDKTSSQTYLHETKNVVRSKCATLTIFGTIVHTIAAICNIVYRLLKIFCFYYFWCKIENNKSYNFTERLQKAFIDLEKVVAALPLVVLLSLAALYGIIRPYDGRKLYASLERAMYGQFVIAPCFQPCQNASEAPHLLGGTGPNQW